jgi:hypothetical protein
MTSDVIAARGQSCELAESWLEHHVPRTARLLTDDTVRVELFDHGFDRRFGVVWFSRLGAVDNLDRFGGPSAPSALARPPIRGGHAVRASGPRPVRGVAQAVAQSVPVASFGRGIDAMVVWRIHAPGTTRPAAVSEGRNTA